MSYLVSPGVCVHRLFEQQVERTPEDVALSCGERRMTYRELNQRANRLAHYLLRRRTGLDTLVGVCLERSPEMVVALLSVWKAGAAYVPLDPTYPRDRLAFLLRDAGLRLVLTEGKVRHLVPDSGIETIGLDADWDRISHECAENPAAAVAPDDIAYVMYTSGSTGQPKGAMILHRGLANYVCWAAGAYKFRQGGIVPVHSSIAFDLTVTSLYPPLLVGGRLELLPESAGMPDLAGALARGSRYNVVKITPAHLALLTHQLAPHEMAGFAETFVVGGESLLAESLQPWRKFARDTRFINEYGPTETVVGCCIHEVQPDDPATGPVPIGRPIPNTTLRLLDDKLDPLPAGMPGQLYIGGAGVARGYLNRPTLTAERFLADRSAEGGRLYKSGDLARLREDGVFEYLGRMDDQIKIRGYRIELGEIEANLGAHPEVQACVVMSREDEPGNRQLVAYLVAREGKTPTAYSLRQFLEQRLPDYMVPAQWAFLDALPLTPNGKIDRKALPAAPHVDVAGAERFNPPRTPTECRLAEIWAKLLNVERVGIDDDFFDLGGHSLMAIRLAARVRDAFGLDMPLQTIFDRPTVSALAAAIDGEPSGGQRPGRIERREATRSTPLSFAQEQLWFLYQLAPESPTYNLADVIRFGADYHAVALLKAVRELQRRHSVLRTFFSIEQGRPVQVISEVRDVTVAQVDLRSVPPLEREAAWHHAAAREVRRPFKLSEPPLLRWLMVHLSDTDHRLLVTIHHIIADEWSMNIIQNEIATLYEAFCQGRESPLPELPIQYADFARWQRERQQRDQRTQLAYWKLALAGAPMVLDLPIDKPRPPTQSFRGATEYIAVGKGLCAQLKNLGQRAHATLFMVLGAAFMALLHRYTGEDDILVGTPATGRTQSETEALVGYFLNTLVLRARFDERLSFNALLLQVRENALAAYAHAEIPFQQLVAEISPQRNPSRSPLFQAMFILHDAGGPSQISKLAQSRPLEPGTSKFDVTLTAAEADDGGLEVLIEYSTDLFVAATAQRMCQHYFRLLAAIARNPDELVGHLAMLSDSERQMIAQWNPPPRKAPSAPLHHLIEAQAARTPDAIAIAFDAQTLSYAELNSAANRLARCLRESGAGRGALVGIHLARSMEMVIALLAVLKSGGAYVPLDPAYPAQRLSAILDDAAPPIVLSDAPLNGVAAPQNTRVLDLGELVLASTRHDDRNLDRDVDADALAYVIFTSGTTGRPKGVAVTHASLVNLLEAMAQAPGIAASDVLLSVTTLAFDIAALELYLPLIRGARVVLCSRDDTLDGRRLIALMESSGTTVMQATPATWRMLIDAGWRGMPGLRLLCGGEALTRKLADAMLCRAKEVWNLYGPTETTVWSSVWRVAPGAAPVSIGRPIANTQIWVLDASLEPVPIGVTGELCIGGTGVARGYWKRPDLTAERFVPDRLSGIAGGRLYRTGDRARWLPDGCLECLGRTDHQMKIRGFRIEAGEVEAALTAHPAVSAAMALARDDGDDGKRLVAYVVAKDPPSELADQLRAHIRSALPDYMMPSALVILDAFPLTSNGKIDRQALPAPEAAQTRPASAAGKPRTKTEAMILELFRDALERKDVGIFDSFFDLGGHSISAARMIAKLQETSGLNVPLRNLFERPNVAGLAEIVDAISWATRAETAPADAAEREEVTI